MKNSLITSLLILFVSAPVYAEEADRYYLFIGTPGPESWRLMIDNPEISDRKSAAVSAVEKLNGELLGYYWSVNNPQNYILVRLPADGETVAASLILQLATGRMIDYKAIELMPSDRMPKVIERLAEIEAMYSSDSDAPEED